MSIQKLGIIGILVLLSSCGFAQNSIISNNDSLTLTWDEVQPDYQGEIVSYRVFMKWGGTSDTIGVYSDTTCTINLQGYSDGFFTFGVQSMDDAGNASLILWSDSELNKYGSWTLRRDTKPPAIVGGIRGIF